MEMTRLLPYCATLPGGNHSVRDWRAISESGESLVTSPRTAQAINRKQLNEMAGENLTPLNLIRTN